MKETMKPSINGIYFENYDIVRGADFSNHIKGDIYYNGECVGYYDPLYHNSDTVQTTTFVRLEDQLIVEKNAGYVSLFANDLTSSEKTYGVEELLKDLEYITYMYQFLHHIQPDDDFESKRLIGLINNEFMQVVNIIDKSVDISNYQAVVKYYNDNIVEKGGQQLDNNYPTFLFRRLNDFKINTAIIINH